ncbi:MAG: hypothetical protein JNM39_08740 [Bdellovibrionaceae bacterium]|nr:hypothetical protein [Pseudobdellovibrionaceae bacterium]
MSGAIRDKIIFVFLFLTLGVSIRWVINHWRPLHPQHINNSSGSGLRKSTNSKLDSSARFSDICWSLEQEVAQDKKISTEQAQFIKAAAPGFCFCMGDQIDKHKYLGSAKSAQEVKHNFFYFLKTTQGQKTKEYCRQVAKFELYRKTGRAVAALKPPAKPLKPKNQSRAKN